MGDFSRNTFQLTNVLHQVLSNQAVADPRHYVAVRLQQGVPLLDSDWNELEDLRRLELQALVKMFVGTGVPAGDDGFRISASGDANNVSIHPGVILADGMLVINTALTTYLAQPEQAGLAPLTTPPGIVERTDVVYLDIWHDEIASAGPGGDSRLVNALVGVETAVRIRRRWQVKVAENATDLGGVVPAAGHSLLPLAVLRRRPGAPVITDAMIIERRVTGLTVSSNLKVPLKLTRGADTVDSARFAQMLRTLRIALFQRLRANQLPHSSSNAQNESFLLIALQDLMNAARAGEAVALSRNVSATDGLVMMQDLYQSQQDWLSALDALGNVGNAAKPFLDDYTRFLVGQPGTGVTGVKPALDASDLIGAVLAQEALNTFLANPVDVLPEGSVIVAYKLVSPFSAMNTGTTFTFAFDVTAQFTSPQANETFSIDVTLPADFGTATPAHTELSFPAGGTPTTKSVSITVNPSGVATSGALQVTAAATRSAALHSSQQPITLTRGANPPPPAFFFYAGPALNAAGQLPIPQTQLSSPTGRNIVFRLKNGSTTDNQTYQVTGQVSITPPAPTTGWSPLTPVSLPPTSLAANTETPVSINIVGPQAPSPPALGTIGNVVATAVLTKINGNNPPNPQTPLVVTIPFIVV
ncbi:MAG TPA: DUF6519 domain-containing protein [Kofleriaceae bacterium]|nr:DUF6519 domain-containing protein [Kofleriaceae bacterium]